jgi:chromosome segregation ATPase
MELMRLSIAKVLVAAALASNVTTHATAQPSTRPASLDDVVRELKESRAELHSTSQASLRVQTLVARVSLQEQRLKALSDQLNDATAQLNVTAQARAELQRRAEYLEDALEKTPAGPERMALEQHMRDLKPELAVTEARETKQRSRVGELSSLVASEQERWTEFNQRLDAIDQALTQPPGGRP